MNYIALYRKYRPQTFDDVIGQEHIISTLRNQILHNKVSHAYLFTGTRGTGKTSTAKIFARAVNCPNAVSHNGNPCGDCFVCNQGANNIDIMEMDAASNNGVDYARDIREKVQYPPVNGRYKVYIIDEVHMLSQGAFNALLKTLEEPPEHALFILCTTEVHKIPATILSRCMRFDFRLVPTDMLASHIGKIYDQEGKKYTPEAVNAIAQAGEGSVRDAVSIADRCFAIEGDKLTYDDVMAVLGVSSKNSITALAKAVLANDAGAILTETDRLVKQGKDIARLAKDLSLYFKDLLTVKLCATAKQMLVLPDDIFAQFKDLANQTTTKKLLYAIDVLVACDTSLRYALSPLMLFESALLKISSSSGEVDVEGLDRRLYRLEQQPHNMSTDTKDLFIVDKTSAESIWRGVKIQLESKNNPLLVGVWRDVTVAISRDEFVVTCSKGAHALITCNLGKGQINYKRELENAIAKFWDKTITFVLADDPSDSTIDDQLNALGNVRFGSTEDDK